MSDTTAPTTLVLQTLKNLDSRIPKHSIRNEKISAWTVGMQIEHCLKSTIGICKAITNSEPYRGKIKKGLIRRIIFLTGMIPRGRGKAPAAAIPDEQTTESELWELMEKATLLVQKAAEFDSACWWEHFVFGVMQRDEALKFIAIHNRHHLKIISDIVATHPPNGL